MTTVQKARAFDEIVNKLRHFIAQGVDPLIARADVQDFFSKLAESEDERIRNVIRGWIYTRPASFFDNGISKEEMLAWLDKHNKPKKVSIWKHWKDGIAGGAEGEQIFLIKIGRVYSISSCLGCECDYIELSELDELMREEKQGKPMWSSLKPQNRWKPSDEQIKAIRLARSFVVDDFGEHPTLSEILMELEEQLQKIKENKLNPLIEVVSIVEGKRTKL